MDIGDNEFCLRQRLPRVGETYLAPNTRTIFCMNTLPNYYKSLTIKTNLMDFVMSSPHTCKQLFTLNPLR